MNWELIINGDTVCHLIDSFSIGFDFLVATGTTFLFLFVRERKFQARTNKKNRTEKKKKFIQKKKNRSEKNLQPHQHHHQRHHQQQQLIIVSRSYLY